jgi:hypothetical protein
MGGFNRGIGKDLASTADIILDAGADVQLDAAGGNIEFKDAGTTKVTLDIDTSATQAVFTHNVDNNAALLCFKQANGVANAGSLDGSGNGGWFHKRYIHAGLAADLDLSDITGAALTYTGAVITVNQDGTHTINLPTANGNAAVAPQIIGWHIRVAVNTAGSNNVTIEGGHASDVLLGRVAHENDATGGDSTAKATGITIGSNVVTFVGSVAVAGDFVDIVCVFADASTTKYFVSGIAST